MAFCVRNLQWNIKFTSIVLIRHFWLNNITNNTMLNPVLRPSLLKNKKLYCHAGCQEFGRCHTRGEKEESIVSDKARKGFTLAWEQVTPEVQKRACKWPHKKGIMILHLLFLLKNVRKSEVSLYLLLYIWRRSAVLYFAAMRPQHGGRQVWTLCTRLLWRPVTRYSCRLSAVSVSPDITSEPVRSEPRFISESLGLPCQCMITCLSTFLCRVVYKIKLLMWVYLHQVNRKDNSQGSQYHLLPAVASKFCIFSPSRWLHVNRPLRKWSYLNAFCWFAYHIFRARCQVQPDVWVGFRRTSDVHFMPGGVWRAAVWALRPAVRGRPPAPRRFLQTTRW